MIRITVRPRLQCRSQASNYLRPRTGRIRDLGIVCRHRFDVIRLDTIGHRIPGVSFRPGNQHAVQSYLRARCRNVVDFDCQCCGIDDRSERNLARAAAEDIVETNQSVLYLRRVVLYFYEILVVRRIRSILFEERVLRAAVATYALLERIDGGIRASNEEEHAEY